jgi:acetyltransferase-like isoleucine patch superfamily enzyme
MKLGNNEIIYPGVRWGGEFILEAYVIVGYPQLGKEPGKVETYIGPKALIRSHTVIYAGNRIGANFQTGHHVLIREDNTIGDDVSIGTGCVVEHDVHIGNGVRLHSNVFVPEFSILEDDCWLGPNVVITNARYPRSPHVKERLEGVVIEEGAKIGANATLLPGIRVRRNALIGAGSVVTHDVPQETVVAGNPAKIINRLSNLPYGEEKL